MKVSHVTGVLLAGGQSKRMGSDKRRLELNGQTIFQRSLAALDATFETVLVSLAEPAIGLPTGGHRIVLDLVPGAATLGGLYSCLMASSTDWIFAVACDMPLVNPSVIRRLVALCDSDDFVMPVLATGPQPMHACYRKSCMSVIERMVHAKELRLQTLLNDQTLRGRRVTETEITSLDPDLRSFLNINTPADFEMVRKLLSPRGSGPSAAR